MSSLPLPGAKEAELMAKVGTGVVQGIRKASQLPPWPDARDALLDLHAILREWCDAAEEARSYAQSLARAREARNSGDPMLAVHERVGNLAEARLGAVGFAEVVFRDTTAVLRGPVSAWLKLRRSRKRRAERRGLRMLMSVYCPSLLDQFEQAVAARYQWIREHRKNFDRWFDDSRSDVEVNQILSEMDATRTALLEAANQLREFITANYPLPGATTAH
ncbi:hypothetical protein [Amycolatopsis dendrobii]|uniref:Uncharacterized protein n=1 Tax=Amycolatopsis dendrobii TaxID=2760662 RepID=A0A7W3VUL4_9PSEU|nr:hypothetical protein [Amycolatopsis dendrobii]MBB1153501.1 hypothetical protein [Amycolatopsis dendrobii]